MIAIRLPSVAAAQAVSRGLYIMSRPEGVNLPQDTQFLASWEVQGDGTAMLIVDPAWKMPLHALTVTQIKDNADTLGTRAKLAALLGPLLTNITTGLPAVRAMIAAGGDLTLGDFVPLIKPALVSAYVPPVRVTP